MNAFESLGVAQGVAPFEVTPLLLYSVRIADARCGCVLLRFLYHFGESVLRFLLHFFVASLPKPHPEAVAL